MYEKSIADPFKNITSSFQKLQKQLENPCRFPEVITNFSAMQLLNQQRLQIENSAIQLLNQQRLQIENSATQLLNQQRLQIENSATQLLNQQRLQIENSVKFSGIITNSFFVEMEKRNKQFSELFKVPNVVYELAAKSIFPTVSSLNFPNIIIPRPTDNSIFPLVPEKRRTPSPKTDSTTFTDEVNEERIPLEERRVPSPQPTPIEISQRVLIVGGCFDGINQIVARFIEQLGFEAIILSEQPNGGRTKFGKFEAYTNVDFAITLLTPDDVGRVKDNSDEFKPRPSQDTIFGLGYLCKQFSPEKIFTLYTAEIELPSYLEGWIHVPMCGDGWKLKLVQEMQFAGLLIDKNKLL